MGTARTCRVSIVEPDGCRHTIEVNASSLYEAAALGLRTFRQYPWGVAALRVPRARVEVVVYGPTEMHDITVVQVERWLHAPPKNPKEKVLKDRLMSGPDERG